MESDGDRLAVRCVSAGPADLLGSRARIARLTALDEVVRRAAWQGESVGPSEGGSSKEPRPVRVAPSWLSGGSRA
jgi:hypothetical protein